MKYDKIFCINPAKVGSGTFYHGFCMVHNEVEHGHNLETLKHALQTEGNNLIIVGFREAWERYISYFFQTYRDNFYNDFKTSTNKYQGEYCLTDIIDKNLDDILYNWEYKLTYFDWIEEFVEITGIKHFDKQNGFSLYNINGHTIVIYTMKHIGKVKKFFENLLDIQIENKNVNKNEIYLKAKEIPPDLEFKERMKSCEAYKIFIEE